MIEGLMYFNDRHLPILEAIEDAALTYQRKYAKFPKICEIHPADFATLVIFQTRTGVAITESKLVIRNNVWIGEESIETPKKEALLFKDGAESEILCPNCMPPRKLIVRTNKTNFSQFLGCPNYPNCDHTRPIPDSWYLRAEGQMELF